MSEPLLQLINIHKSYRMGNDLVPVLRGVDFEIMEGEFVAIMGASGSGKSTLLHIAGALDHPDFESAANGGRALSSQIIFKNQPLSAMNRRDRHTLRNRQFGFVFQFYHLLPELNVLENVLLPSMIDRTPKWLTYGILTPGVLLAAFGLATGLVGMLDNEPLHAFLGILSAVIGAGILLCAGFAMLIYYLIHRLFLSSAKKQEALELLEAFGLSHRLKHRPAQLSGGERQRVAIARALINQPALLLADEPTGNLDAKTGRTILDVLVRLHKERGQTLLLVTHDPNVAALADRTVHLVEGRIRT